MPAELAAPTPLALPQRMRFRHRARLVVEILAAYVPLRRLLRRNDLRAMVAGARARGDRRIPTPADPHDTAVRLGWIVNRVLRLLPTDGRCLIQSLVLVRLLAVRTIDARVIIGVSTDDGFSAHAWVEHDGVAVLPAGRFARLMEV